MEWHIKKLQKIIVMDLAIVRQTFFKRIPFRQMHNPLKSLVPQCLPNTALISVTFEVGNQTWLKCTETLGKWLAFPYTAADWLHWLHRTLSMVHVLTNHVWALILQARHGGFLDSERSRWRRRILLVNLTVSSYLGNNEYSERLHQ